MFINCKIGLILLKRFKFNSTAMQSNELPTYQIKLCQLVGKKQYAEAFDCYQEMTRRGIKPKTVQEFNTVLNLHTRTQKPNKVFSKINSLLQEMEEDPETKPDRYTYSLLINVLKVK